MGLLASLRRVTLLLVLFAVTTFSTFTEESGYLDTHKNDKELNTILKHLQYLASTDAKPEERADLIKNGYAKSAEHYRIPVSSTPMLSTVKLDCKVKKLAFSFAKKIATRGLLNIFDGLQLGSLCNVTFDPSTKKNFDNENRYSDKTLEIFVDQVNGRLHYDGSFMKPLADIQSGINRCTETRKNDEVKCIILIRSGVYHIRDSITIRHSNVSLVAYENEVVKVSSDIVIEPKWKLYKSTMEEYKGFNPIFEGIKPKQTTKSVIFVGVMNNSTMCNAKCVSVPKCTSFAFFDKTTGKYANQCYIRVDGRWNTLSNTGVVSGKKVLIYSADLSEYMLKNVNSVFINHRRAIRARYPNANPETMGLHTVPTGYVGNADKWLPAHPAPDAAEVHIKSPIRPATLFPGFDIGIGGPVYQFDPPQSYWGTKHPVGGGGCTYKVPSGLQYSKDLEINLRSWKKPSTGIVHAYQHYHWGNWMFKLDGRNEKDKTLLWTYGGFQESRGANDGKEWYVENILEELDVANEWFYDEDTKFLYYSPNVTADDLPSKLSIPQLDCLLGIVGTQSHPVVNTVVRGLFFLHTMKTFLKPYAVPSGGDWSVHKNAMVYVEGTENTMIDYCTFDSPEGNGLLIINYNRGTQISNNLMYFLGDNGIVLLGDSHMIDGSQGAQPRGVKVLFNTIFENGIWGKQTYAFVQSRSCESYLEGNVFFNGPRGGVNINDGFGGGNVINNNLLFNFVRETDDHGPINTWDRVPYLTTLYDGKQVSLYVKENQIHHNFIINNYRSVWPIDHDDGSCYWNDTHNYLVYGGFKNYLGYNKHSIHNVYVYPDKAGGRLSACVDSRGQTLGTSGYGDVYQKNTCIIGTTSIYQLGSCNPIYIRELIPWLAENHYYTPKGGLVARCGSEKWNFEQFQAHGMEIETIVEDLVDDDQVIMWGKELLNIK